MVKVHATAFNRERILEIINLKCFSSKAVTLFIVQRHQKPWEKKCKIIENNYYNNYYNKLLIIISNLQKIKINSLT